MRMEPYPWQEADIKAIVKNHGNAFIVTQVGGGKTLVATEAAKRLKFGTIMVIAPQGTHEFGWRRHVKAQYGEDLMRRIDSSVKGKAALADLQWQEPGWYICTPQWFARQTWTNFKPDMVIFDEIHVAGAYQNITRKKLYQLQPTSRMGLSGTPFRNKIENAWSLVNWIFPEHIAKDYWTWRVQDLDTVYDRFAPQNRKVVGEKVPGQLVNSLPLYIQHLQREKCCKFHPKGFLEGLEEPEVEIRTVQMTPKQKKFYKQMEENYVAWLSTPDDKGNLPVVAELPIVARGMLRFCALGLPSFDERTEKLYFEPDCESPKLDELEVVLDEIGEETALVFTHSQKFAAVVVARLNQAGVAAAEWSGDITQTKRNAVRDEWLAGNIRVVVATIKAAGTGTDGFQLATNTEIWLSEDDDQTDDEQGRGRTDRPGQTRRVSRIYIQAEDTYDQGIMSKGLEHALKMSATLRKAA